MAVGISDVGTGEYPEDLDKIGELRIDLWDFHTDLQNTAKGITNSLEQLHTHQCTQSYLDSVHTDVHNALFGTIGANAVCLAEDQEIELHGDLDELSRKSLQIELHPCEG